VARLRSALAAPGGARLVGVLVALVGVALLIVGVVALGGGSPGTSGAAPAPASSSAPSTSAPSTSAPTPTAASATEPSTEPSASPTPRPTTPTPTPAPPARTSAARAPVTVLNNSVIKGLADRAAAQVQAQGWQVAQVGNFAGRLEVTTVYYTPGNAAQEAAARELAREFSQVNQVLPRYAGLPPTPAGIVLVITKDW
jgi:hypothetical protein